MSTIQVPQFLQLLALREIPVRPFTRRGAGDATRHLQECNEHCFGVAIRQSDNGFVDSLALATTRQVFVISVEADSSRGIYLSDQPFRNLLEGGAGILVGFEMAKIALHLRRDLGLNVNGVDLSTLFSPDTRKPWRPSQVLAKALSRSVSIFEVDGLWNSGAEQGTRTLCLRAWVSWFVDRCTISHLTEV